MSGGKRGLRRGSGGEGVAKGEWRGKDFRKERGEKVLCRVGEA